ncbi:MULTISPECIES: RimK family alpha-L-glutamate ligase [Streptomyces]|uniref:ATP-grasp domain-containing protein n=1 Tax=Streptomyces TaxID=1883 RepID=UPI000A9271AC|nr:hypothetical protein [Streptomyces virginiae]
MKFGIVTLDKDIHAYAVQAELKDRLGSQCYIFSNMQIGSSCLNWSLDDSAPSTLLSADGEQVNLKGLDLLWFRRHPKVDATSAGEFGEFISSNQYSALRGMLRTEARRCVDPPETIAAAENKLVQLRVARNLGFRTPKTLVSQSPDKVKEFFSDLDGRVIAKPLRLGSSGGVITKMVGANLLDSPEVIRSCSTIYQEFIPGTRHIRAHVFGERILAATIESEDLDWRPNLQAAKVTQFSLPSDVQNLLRKALSSLDLTMGVFDLKMTSEGEFVWLEVNPQGQFLFIEGMCDLPLKASVADFLYSQAVNVFHP